MPVAWIAPVGPARWAAAGLSRLRAGSAGVPVHADREASALVHAQFHLHAFAGTAGVFDGHPAAGLGRRRAAPPFAAVEQLHAHAVLRAAGRAHARIERQAFIIHISHAFPGFCRTAANTAPRRTILCPRRNRGAAVAFAGKKCYTVHTTYSQASIAAPTLKARRGGNRRFSARQSVKGLPQRLHRRAKWARIRLRN